LETLFKLDAAIYAASQHREILLHLHSHVKRESGNMDKKIVIKKYENRRLYDVTHSRYVNLDEIARAVQNGYDLQVLNAATGEDITRVVMTQIITECAKAPDSVFPLDILREMIIASGKATQENALNYMRTVTDMYKNAWRGFAHVMSPFELMQQMMNSTSSPPANQVPSESGSSKVQEVDTNTELQALKRRIQELESLISKGKKETRPRKMRARPRAKS